MFEVEHIRTQHPVGQGSFHSASVIVDFPSGQHRFDYVYDCGALSGARRTAALERALDNYEPRIEARIIDGNQVTCSVIDALVLSHFDSDHMNGAEKLTCAHTVDRIYVPYLSPVELSLEIARQAETLSAQRVTELFTVANGGGLWGSQVVRVIGGSPDRERPPRPDNGRPLPQGDGIQRQAPASVRTQFPQAAEMVTADGAPILGTLAHDEDVLIDAAGSAFWQFRFWNHEVADELVYYALSLLDAVGFPIEALESRDGATEIVAWLGVSENRRAAVEAYVEAIRMYEESWTWSVSYGHVPNLISLTLFSGPWHWEPPGRQEYRYDVVGHDLEQLWWHHRYWGDESHRVGWLGTGDALLGEAAIWEDFAKHYKLELARTRTVLLPHHGAAPVSGPAYYHAMLNALPYTVSVLSVGTRNPYGHPKDAVLSAVLRRHGIPTVVTEKWTRGFTEFVSGPK